ncbi:SpoIIE family protein phosphatase [Streptomyces barringtoniae]|uniref:SpoIIE family protein phosphatase n=1 Tax=Streptomyces barringtoniae TaxID=2892029 RepID=UPI001E3D7867|nr:SpoIIE family protein phosphatase [Streptomyces barringtoniae]MCC5474621.1 SpoIIE family protein phosphatase [Streptomyces barringtoniae]
MDEAILAALFSESPIGLHVLDTQLRIVRFNSAARHIHSFPLKGYLGRPLGELLRDYGVEDADVIESMVREVLRTGTPKRDVLIRLRSRREPYTEAAASVSWFRLQDAQERPLGVAAALLDVTDRYRAQARLALLERASGRIGTSMDLFSTAQELADAAVPEFADTVTVDLLDPVLRGEAPESGPLVGGIPLRRAGWSSMHSIEESGSPMAGEVSGFPAESPFRHSMADLRPRLIGRLDPEAGWLSNEPFRYRLLTAIQVHSMIVTPMRARGLVLGLACFYRWRSPDAYEDDDLTLAEQLTARTALYLDNARQYIRGRSAARLLQPTPRPPEFPVHSAVETAHSYVPCQSGGDWFDVIPLPGGRVALVAGAISGQGTGAVTAMGELRAAIGALAALDLPPDELLERLHELVARLSGQESHPSQDASGSLMMGAHCLYAIYDPVTRQCAMSRAGALRLVAVLPGGSAELAGIPSGPALGQGMPAYRTAERELPEGSVLILNSTALPRGCSLWDVEGRLDEVSALFAGGRRSLQEACDAVTRVLVHEQPGRPDYDVNVLLARTRAFGPDRLASWELRHEPESASKARKLTADRLTAWEIDELAFTTELVVSELVTNAVRYSDGPIGLRLIRDRTLVCEVTDTSSTVPQLRRAEDTDEGGRGLYLTAQLTQRWGTRPARRGKIIWAEQTIPDDSP